MRATRACASVGAVTPVLSAVELTKRFGDVTAVIDLSFDLDAGSVAGFLGPNGAGKTTTLRMLLGLAEPTHGHALVFGRRFADLERPASRVGAVLEASDLHPARSGRDHLRVLAPAARVPRRAWTRCSRWSTWSTRPTAGSGGTRSACVSA
jgi:ABC-2 type transport system ATP-binding protein